MKIKEWVQLTNDWFTKNRVKDSSDVIWEKGADGVRAFLANTQPISGGSSSEYKGYFKVKKYTEDEVDTYWVINGADEDAVYCGSFTAGSQNVSCISEEVTGVSGAGVIYIKIFWDEGLEEYDYEFGFSATLPTVEQEIYITLASVSTTGNLSQVWISGAITYLNGAYVL